MGFCNHLPYMVISIEYNEFCWLGCIMAIDAEAGSVMVTFLHLHLPAPLFTIPEPSNIQDVDISETCLPGELTTATRRTYTPYQASDDLHVLVSYGRQYNTYTYRGFYTQ